ncbi:sulfotransferase [Sphaerisporangium flaviroseum]|uniref:Sulfotransferase n=1 Tax=Sphaerisporangium flaviroseum TaxID=509199 RepID=A0ABP7J6Z4_9ACTN
MDSQERRVASTAMDWKRKANQALSGLTGLQISKAGTSGSVPGPFTATAAAETIRPPADRATDRLLTAPVFIISPVRSGSTLLRALLDAHSKLHAPHELHVRRLTVGFGTLLAEQAMEALGHNQADLEHLLWDRVLHRELVRSGKETIVDKTPANAFAYKRLITCWPDARFVFLLRHPVSIARSWHEASPEKRSQEEAALDALRYMKAVEKARSALTGPTLRYEDLTADPERETRRVCDFLGIPWEPGMLTYGDRLLLRKGLGDWKDKIRSGTVQAGRELPPAEEIPDALRSICVRWGYTADQAEGP